MDLLSTLNPEQTAAIKHGDGPLLIVAGAGTGKTTVVTQRIAWLIAERKAKPEEILALTFTEKAAGEMEERVDRLLPYGYVDLWISTFHSFAERLLRQHAIDIGLPGDFTLLDQTSQWMLVRRNLDRFDLDYYRPLGNPAKFIHALLQHFSRLKDENITPQEYLAYAETLQGNTDNAEFVEKQRGKKQGKNQELPARLASESVAGRRIKNQGKNTADVLAVDERTSTAEDDPRRVLEVAKAYHTYQRLLLEQSALDFGDLIVGCLQLLQQRPAILEHYRKQFRYVLVDEFQDTNWAQYQLVKLLAAPTNNLTVVADDDQSIYRFRGASMSNIVAFENDYPEAQAVFLTRNYRSRQNILDLAYQFIQNNNPERLEYRMKNQELPARLASESVAGRRITNQGKNNKVGEVEKAVQKLGKISKQLTAERTGTGTIEHLHAAAREDEVMLVVEKIQQLAQTETDVSWNDFAILVRANASATPFLIGLDRAGIPYQFVASKGLYSKPIILDIISYLRLLDNYHESAAAYRILSNPLFGLGDYDVVQLATWAQRKSASLYEAMRQAAGIPNISRDGYTAISRLLQLVEKHSNLARTAPVTVVVLAFLEDAGYLRALAKTESQENRTALQNLNQFYKKIEHFSGESDDKSVREFLAFISLERESGEAGSIAQGIDEGPEQVKVLTVHAAKGLEFRYVFIVSLVDKRFPTIERGEPIDIPAPLVKEIVPTGDFHLAEERRLFYVALTRARDGLFLSSAEDYGGVQKKKLSRFLHECGFGVIPKPAAFELTAASLRRTAPQKIALPQLTPPVKFSFTQLKTFDNCPYQYRFSHVLKIPVHGKGVFSYGQAMHLTLQRAAELALSRQQKKPATLFEKPKTASSPQTWGDLLKEAELVKLFEEAWIDDWFRSADERQHYQKQGKTSIKHWYEKQQAQIFQTLHVEQGFAMKVAVGEEYFTLRGKIDRIDHVDGKLVLLDYKTGAAKTKLVAEDKEQLLIYQMAASEIYEQPIAALVYQYLDDGSTQEFIGNEKDITAYREKMVKLMQNIRRMQFPPTPGRICAFCDFREICEFRAA